MSKLRTFFRTAANTSSASPKKSGPAKVIPITFRKSFPEPLKLIRPQSAEGEGH
jgi:hypothetical protein